jgi:hypothetical protein
MNEEIKGENRAPTRTPLDVADERDEASMGIGRLRRSLRHLVRTAMAGEIGPGVSSGVAQHALRHVAEELGRVAPLSVTLGSAKPIFVDLGNMDGLSADEIGKKIRESLEKLLAPHKHETITQTVTIGAPEAPARLTEDCVSASRQCAPRTFVRECLERAAVQLDLKDATINDYIGEVKTLTFQRDNARSEREDAFSRRDRLIEKLIEIASVVGCTSDDGTIADKVRALVAERNGLHRAVADRDAQIKSLADKISTEASAMLDWAAREVTEVASDFAPRSPASVALYRAMSRIRKAIAKPGDGAPIGPELAAHLRTMPGDPLKAGTTPLSVAPYAVRTRRHKKAWEWYRHAATKALVRFDTVGAASLAINALQPENLGVDFQVARYSESGAAHAVAETPIRTRFGKPAKKGAKK